MHKLSRCYIFLVKQTSILNLESLFSVEFKSGDRDSHCKTLISCFRNHLFNDLVACLRSFCRLMMCLAKMVCFFVHLAITHGCHCNSIDAVGDVFMGCSQKGLKKGLILLKGTSQRLREINKYFIFVCIYLKYCLGYQFCCDFFS